MNVTETLSVLELLIIIMGLPGLTVSILLIAVFQGQRTSLRKAGINGVNKRLTNADLRNEIFAAWKLAGFITIGILSALVPPRTGESNLLISTIIASVVISWEVVETLGSLWRFVDFRKNKDAVREVEIDRHDVRDLARDNGRDIIRDEARDVARDIEHDTASRSNELNTARDKVRDPARDEARDIIRDNAHDIEFGLIEGEGK